MKQTPQTLILAIGLLVLMLASTAHYVVAVPGGATILSNTTSGAPVVSPSSRTDERGTITTIVLDSLQQDQNWKAYVGNITGMLSLDDANGNTIYDWELNSVNRSGEVYVTRSNSILWPNVSCVTPLNVTAEEAFHNMTAVQADNINKTFNATSHAQFYVGTVSIAQDSCKSTAPYVNNETQAMDGTQRFQEVMLRDTDDKVVFVSLVTGNNTGFDGRQYDFQIIVPESAIKATPTTYYFFTELSG